MSPRRLSIRARLTAAFVAALAVVLALAGLFVYLRTGSELSGAIDDGLEVRAADLAALVAAGGPDSQELTGTLFEGEEGFSEILTTDGRVVASTLGDGAGTALDPADPGAGHAGRRPARRRRGARPRRRCTDPR